MTTYTSTAIATNSVTNTVTVTSIANMVPGIPITFSGVTFGGITTGGTYYIGAIVYGYPTSSVTLTSLPGGAVFQLTTATGSMTATWSSGGQQMVSTIPPGESLNTSFTKINTNFDQIWAAGPVGSNVQIAGDTISTLDTNGDLILNPNGTGNVVANAHVIPDTTRIRNLGSPTRYWDTIYVQYGNIDSLNVGQLIIPVSNLHILGGNTNNFLQTDGTGNLSWSIPETAAGGDNTQIQYNDNGVLAGSDAFTFNSNTSTVTLQNITTTGVANLNYVGNVQISGGTAGYVLQTDGSGNLSWTTPTGNINSILDQQIYGDGSTVNFNLITSSVTNAVIVSINGVMQIPSVAYTVATDVITFAEAPQTSDLVDIRFLVFGESSNNSPGGATGFIQFNSGNGFGGSGNLRYNDSTGNLYSANVTVSGNITAGYYYGDGGLLSNITATADTGNITFANNVVSTSDLGNTINIIAPQSTPVSMATGGNAATSQMLWATNIGALTPEDTFNAVVTGNTQGSQISAGNTGVVIASNSAAGLQTWTFDTAGTLTGNGSILAGNITANVDVSAVGNVSGSYVLGNARFMTGIPVGYGNSNVANFLNGSTGNVIPIANISYSLGNSTNQWKDLWVSNSTIYINSVPLTVEGNTLQIDGANVVTYSTGNSEISVSGTVTAGNISSNGNISASGNISGARFAGDGSRITNVNIISNGTSSANIGTADGNLAVTIGGNVWTFDSAGNVIFPDNTFQTTGYQKVAAPSTAQGELGDAAGMVAYSNTATYYCTTDYATETPTNVADTAWNDANSVTMDKASVPVQPQAGAGMYDGLGATYPVTGSTDGGSYWIVSTSGSIPSFGGSSDIWTITQIQPDIWVNVAWGGGGSANTGNFIFDSYSLDDTAFDEIALTGTNSGNILINADGLVAVLGGYESSGIVANETNVYIFNNDPTFVDGIPQPGVGYIWQFDNNGNLNVPQGGWIGAAGVKGDGTMLTGGTGQIASLTSFYADAPGVYSSCLTANPDGTLNITTYGNGTGQLGQWIFSGADLSAPGNITAGNISLNGGYINGGVATVVNDGINSIALALGAQMDVFTFPFTVVPTRGQLTISGDISTTEALGTWYYQATSNNAYQLYTDGSYSTLVDATTWTPYTGGGAVAITEQTPAANIVINANGYISTFTNAGQLNLPGSLTAVGDIGTDGNVYARNIVAETPFEIQVYNFNADIGGRYGVDTQTNTVTATLPAAPPTGGAVFFADAAGAYNINNLIVDPNGGTIMGATGNMTVSTPNQSVGLFWNGTTWRIYNAG